jgi:hypothetical protein
MLAMSRLENERKVHHPALLLDKVHAEKGEWLKSLSEGIS